MTTNHQSLLCFTNTGRVYNLKVYQLPEAALRSRGKHFANLIKLESEESIISVLPVQKFVEGVFIYSATSMGYVKKTSLMSYANVRSSGIIGLKLEPEDELVSCVLGEAGDHLFMGTREGKVIRFNEDQIRATGRASRGVTGIRFMKSEDQVVGMEVIRSSAGKNAAILSVCENGYGKRSHIADYRLQSRGGKGIYTIKVSKRNGRVVGLLQVDESDHVMIMTSKGKLVRLNISDVSMIGRVTQGVRLMHTGDKERVICIGRVPNENEDLDEQSQEPTTDTVQANRIKATHISTRG